MEDNVLQRPMFNAPQQPGSVAPTTGIATVRSPRDTANELRNMFAPTVPVQSFNDGGLVRDPQDLSGIGGGGAAFPGGAAEVAAPPPTASSGSLLETLSRPFRAMTGQPVFRPPSEVQTSAGGGAGSAPPPPPRPPSLGGITEISADELARMRDADRLAESGTYTGRPAPIPAAPALAAERPKGEVQLTLEGIKADRARLAEEKKQNAMLALMQAGLAMAAGRSPSAISNIAAGGQAGIAAFAGMEKDRRAEDASLRREQTSLLLERERMRAQEERAPEQIRTYAALGGWDPTKGREGFDEAVRRGIEVTKSLQQDPETIRTFRALGGGDMMKGFEIFNADKKLQAAIAVTKDITASEEDKRAANDYIRGQLMRARTGGGSFEGFSATTVR